MRNRLIALGFQFWIDWFSLVVLATTLILLYFYTKYTHKLYLEAKESKEKEYEPFLYIDNIHNIEYCNQERLNRSYSSVLSIQNLGKDLAFDVYLDKYQAEYWTVMSKKKRVLLLQSSHKDTSFISKLDLEREKKQKNRKKIKKYYLNVKIKLDTIIFLHLQ